jgi:hypothetical protein
MLCCHTPNLPYFSIHATTPFKTIFGDRLSAREEQRQKTEARIKCAALNRMTRLGMPESYRVN